MVRRACVWSSSGARKLGPTGVRGHSRTQYTLCHEESTRYRDQPVPVASGHMLAGWTPAVPWLASRSASPVTAPGSKVRRIARARARGGSAPSTSTSAARSWSARDSSSRESTM